MPLPFSSCSWFRRDSCCICDRDEEWQTRMTELAGGRESGRYSGGRHLVELRPQNGLSAISGTRYSFAGLRVILENRLDVCLERSDWIHVHNSQ